MLHRGHFQESIAKFRICIQLGLIRDVTPLVIEITYLNTADCIILWTGTGGGGGFLRNILIFLFFSMTHTTVYMYTKFDWYAGSYG
jgi:hypothetical protein